MTNSGRVTGLAVSPGSPQTLYLASAGGGVWSSTTNGASWTTHTDTQPDIAMGSVAVDPSNPLAIFGGTGEDNDCGDCYFGDGILESTDGGATWTLSNPDTLSNPSGIFTGVDTSSLVVEPGAASLSTTTVLAGTSDGLFVSDDGGGTWAPEAGTNWVSGNVSNIALNTLTNPITIYAAVAGAGIEESTDNGASWMTFTSAPLISGSSFQNAAIAIHPGSSPATTTLYVSLGSFDRQSQNGKYLGMFKSTDGGADWSSVTVLDFTGAGYAYDDPKDINDQSNYDNALIVSPTDPNVVVAGGIAIIGSTDGGKNWFNLNGKAFFDPGTNLIHPDFHALAFDSSGNLFIGCDGGAWKLDAAGVAAPSSVTAADYTNLNTNLDITQFYPGAAQSGDAATILAGAQDNGTALYSSSGSPPTTWPEVVSGDGGFGVIDSADPSTQFAQADRDLLGTTDRWATPPNYAAPLISSRSRTKCPYVPVSTCVGGNFTAPLALVGSVGPTLLFGGSSVYQSTDGGAKWSSAPTSYSASAVSALAVAPSNNAVLYAGFNDGTLQVSTNGGMDWNTLVTSGSTPTDGEYITHITVSGTDPNTVYVTLANEFSQVSPERPEVLVGTSLGTSPSWTNVTGDLPSGLATNSVISNGANGLIVANDVGVFQATALNGSSTAWTALGTNLPDVQVMDVLLTSNGTLIATTHGRGVWTLAMSGAGSAPTITSAANTTATVGVPFNFSVTSTGTPTPAISLASGSTLPPGVTLTDNGNGTASLAGTASVAAGTYDFTMQAVNGISPNAIQAFTLTVTAAATTPPAFTSTAIDNVSSGVPFSFSVTTTGAPTPAISLASGSTLPTGVTLTDNGNGTASLAGTASVAAGTYKFMMQAVNGISPNAIQDFTLTLTATAAPAFTSAATDNVSSGTAFSFSVTTTGAPTPAISLASGSTLPTGVTLTDNGNGTASLAGTASVAAGTYKFMMQAVNGISPNALQVFTLTLTATAVPTTLTATLSGDGQSGNTVVVPSDMAVVGQATLNGSNASSAGGTVTYSIYSLSLFHFPMVSFGSAGLWYQPVTGAGTVAVTNGSVPPSQPVTLSAGVYFWQASYSGDALDSPSMSTLGAESEIVLAPPQCPLGASWWSVLCLAVPPSPPFPHLAASSGYDLVGQDGGVFVFPTNQRSGFYGSLPGLGISVNNIVGMVPSPDDRGYFLVGQDGGVFAFGDAPFLGSLPGLGYSLHDIMGIVPTRDNRGYFLVGQDGGVFAFGDAPFLGSLPGSGIHVNDVIGIATSPSDRGYWLVTANGTVYAFGNAAPFGSVTGTSSPVAGITSTSDGGGYWIVTQDGGVFAFGDARFSGSLPGDGVAPARPVIGLVPTAGDRGYWLIGGDGGVFAFGDAPFVGSLPGIGIDITDVVGAVPTTS